MILPLKEFGMLRHGQTISNADGVLSGSKDVPLNKTGIAEAQAIQKIIREMKPDIIIHSHRKRAIDTAAIGNQGLGAPMVEDQRIAEQDFGDWEGEAITEIRPYILRGDDPPNGETNKQFYNRVREGIHDGLTKHEGLVLFVCHGGLWRAIPALYGQEAIPKAQNCVPHLFTPNPDTPSFPWNVSAINKSERPHAPTVAR